MSNGVNANMVGVAGVAAGMAGSIGAATLTGLVCKIARRIKVFLNAKMHLIRAGL